MDFIGKLGQALQSADSAGEQLKSTAKPSRLLARDDQTGEAFLKLPIPEPNTLKKFADAFSALAKALQNPR